MCDANVPFFANSVAVVGQTNQQTKKSFSHLPRKIIEIIKFSHPNANFS